MSQADERLRLWVRSGGRCALCKKYLLEGELTVRPLLLGEGAHIVGQQASEASPRGRHALPTGERDLADNLILLCPDDHSEIDKRGALDLATVEWLRERKLEHEAWIREITGYDPKRGTAILRMVGDVRGRSVELGVETATGAVVRTDARTPHFALSTGNAGIEIDLRQMPGEVEGTPAYWQMCKQRIDDTMDHKLVEAVRRGIVTHVSVFAFARLPLLVYLGSKLDDTYQIAVYQRQRSNEAWGWPTTSERAFTIARASSSAPEAVLILNVSGTIDPADLPATVRDLPRFEVSIEGLASVDAIASRASLLAFEAAARELLAGLEADGKTVRRLHVFAAMPVSAAVVLGRAHDRHVHPALAIYDRADGAYRLALEIS